MRDHIAKVEFFESEADRVALELKRRLFGSELEHSRELHLRYFIESIESISDMAEDVAESIGVAAAKRSV